MVFEDVISAHIMIGRSSENGKENGHQTIFEEKRYSPQAEMILTLAVYL